MPTDMLLKLFN